MTAMDDSGDVFNDGPIRGKVPGRRSLKVIKEAKIETDELDFPNTQSHTSGRTMSHTSMESHHSSFRSSLFRRATRKSDDLEGRSAMPSPPSPVHGTGRPQMRRMSWETSTEDTKHDH